MARKLGDTSIITAVSNVQAQLVATGAAALVVIHGDGLGKKYDLGGSNLTIGRSRRSDIQVDQESVSRSHARLKTDGNTVTIQDDGSTNGTYVNDQATDGAISLRHGDFIKIGRTIFKFLAGNNIEAAYHDEVYRLTTVDGLTQVFNRRYFEDTLERELARCHRHHRALSLVMIDIDFFKKINDQHGHLAGDVVLRSLANLIKTRVRREDVVARYGGEEFVLMLPEINQKGAVVLAEKLRKAVEKNAFTFDQEPIPVTISAGVASTGKQLEESQALVKQADVRLYEAKAAGRNCVIG
jgi:diguanylate cyclase (GGDEF)-like protein